MLIALLAPVILRVKDAVLPPTLRAFPIAEPTLTAPLDGIKRVNELATLGMLLAHQPGSSRPPLLIFRFGSV